MTQDDRIVTALALVERVERSVERIETKVDEALAMNKAAITDIAVLRERLDNMKDAPARLASVVGLILSLLAVIEIVFKLLPAHP